MSEHDDYLRQLQAETLARFRRLLPRIDPSLSNADQVEKIGETLRTLAFHLAQFARYDDEVGAKALSAIYSLAAHSCSSLDFLATDHPQKLAGIADNADAVPMLFHDGPPIVDDGREIIGRHPKNAHYIQLVRLGDKLIPSRKTRRVGSRVGRGQVIADWLLLSVEAAMKESKDKLALNLAMTMYFIATVPSDLGDWPQSLLGAIGLDHFLSTKVLYFQQEGELLRGWLECPPTRVQRAKFIVGVFNRLADRLTDSQFAALFPREIERADETTKRRTGPEGRTTYPREIINRAIKNRVLTTTRQSEPRSE